ncbi:hypothetical protein IQ06DRAFT_70308 [Phaeosphaeriaceae sp. SRC1lsM3a]|nr:hypothetical protein IQ06DRAFT_70308 [Stagonospora sp. SRC1lsM3a]
MDSLRCNHHPAYVGAKCTSSVFAQCTISLYFSKSLWSLFMLSYIAMNRTSDMPAPQAPLLAASKFSKSNNFLLPEGNHNHSSSLINVTESKLSFN